MLLAVPARPEKCKSAFIHNRKAGIPAHQIVASIIRKKSGMSRQYGRSSSRFSSGLVDDHEHLRRLDVDVRHGGRRTAPRLLATYRLHSTALDRGCRVWMRGKRSAVCRLTLPPATSAAENTGVLNLRRDSAHNFSTFYRQDLAYQHHRDIRLPLATAAARSLWFPSISLAIPRRGKAFVVI